MTKQELQSAMADFSKKGGKVAVVPAGVTAIDPGLRHCRCGCRGNYTDHTMRLGEKGMVQ
jgi:hypothetical protein